MQQTSSKTKSQGFIDYMAVALSYKHVFNDEPTWEKVRGLLEPYSLERIVELVCWINAALYKTELPWEPGVQLRICQGIFGNISGEILAAVKRLGQEMERDE